MQKMEVELMDSEGTEKKLTRIIPDAVIMLGPTGSGRANQITRLCLKYNYLRIGMSELLSAARDNQNAPHHLQVIECDIKGIPVPAKLMCDIILYVLQKSTFKRIVFDDFPNNFQHMDSFVPMIIPHINLAMVVFLYLPTDICVQRMTAHIPLGHEKFMKMAEAENNINQYLTNVKKPLEFFRKIQMLLQVDAKQSPVEIFADIEEGLDRVVYRLRF